MTEEQKQVFITAKIGDGCLVARGKMNNVYAVFSSINKDYMEFKQDKLGDIRTTLKVKDNQDSTYASISNCKPIYTLSTNILEDLKTVFNYTLKDCLNNLTDLGLAMWFYDDGSLHKTKHFYNLNTHSFTEYEHDSILVPYFKSIGLEVRKRIEKKKNGKIYFYLYIPTKESKVINTLLKKYNVPSMSYKTWSSETISEESKTQESLKSTTLEIVKI